MKKVYLYLFLFFIFLMPSFVYASSANIQVSAPGSAYVGDTVKVSVTISSSASIGSWQYNISYDDSKLSYVSSNAETPQSVANNTLSSGKKNVTYTWTFKAIGEGSASFKVNGVVVGDFDTEEGMSISGSKSASVNISKRSSGGSTSGGRTNYKASSNNTLSSLSIEGYDIGFNKDKTEYSIVVPNDVRTIKIGATCEDSKAKVNGIGDFNLVEGDNKVSITVTAENGEVRTYNINVVVEELSPIPVSVDGKSLNVIRNADKLPSVIATYTSDTCLINGEEVPCYKSELVDFKLVGLRDDDGNTNLYMYDGTDKFDVYTQLEFGGIYIALLPSDGINGYKSDLVKIGEKEYPGFIKENYYPLIYGVNLETGEKNFYSYDSSENTIQKFIPTEVKSDNNSFYLIIGLASLSLFLFILLIVTVISKNKKINKRSYKTFNKSSNNLDNTSASIFESNTDLASNKCDSLINKDINKKVYKKEQKDLKKLNKKNKKSNDDMYHF